jgi:hypothetical protein
MTPKATKSEVVTKTRTNKKREIEVVATDTITQQFAKKVYERTCAWADKNGLSGKKDDGYCAEAMEWDKLIRRWNFGCQEGGVREIIEKMRSISLPTVKKDGASVDYEIGVAVVPLTDPNSHKYDLGEPVLICSKVGHGIRHSGVRGTNQLPNNSKTAIRPATLDEIEYLLDNLAAVDGFGTMALGFILENFGK